MGDSVTGIATTHKAYLDSLSADDYQHMGISATVLKNQVRYSNISDLNVNNLATEQKKENHRRRLVQAWGTDWEHRLQCLLAPNFGETFLWRLARFAKSVGKDMDPEICYQEATSIIHRRNRASRTSKSRFL